MTAYRPNPTTEDARIDRLRYFRITGFFARVIMGIIFWDLLIGRIWLVGAPIRSRRPQRYRRISRRFRGLASNMGGVMIKLGQFLSARVDVLPPEIIEELIGLQDEVPAVPTEAINEVLRTELGDLRRVFVHVEEQPLAAASLGQTHRAQLRSIRDGASSVVVKVQRPGIERSVRTDLSALRIVARWVMRYRPIRTRANVPNLMEEFAETLWEELDYIAELNNAEKFSAMFDDYDGMYVPRFHRRYCTPRVLVIENVESLKVNDLEGMAAAGVDSKQVADRLLDVYFIQVFEKAFFHADPHAGNIFLRPRPDLPHTNDEPTPFEIIFIDFGMMGRINDQTNELLRRVLISVTTRDARGLTDAYDHLGFFLPGADLDRITEAQEKVLDQIWGRELLDLANPDFEEMQELGMEFKDLLFDFPFQIPQNFIYLGRALGMLSGLSAQLNPTINPWIYVERYGRKMAGLGSIGSIGEIGMETVLRTLREYAAVPRQLKRVLSDAEAGRLKLQFKPDRKTEQQLERLEKRTRQLNTNLVSVATLLAGTILYVGEEPTIGIAFWSTSAVMFVVSSIRNF